MEIKRFFVISDLHFGVRSNSIEWLEIQKSYFYDWFIPTVKTELKEGDALLIMGDVFDNRQHLNILVQNAVIDLFEKLVSLFKEVHVLIGNHDIFKREVNDINSLKNLKHISGIFIYEKPVMKKIAGKSVLLMPWRKNHEAEKETLEQYGGSDFLFCHSEVCGVKLNNKVVYEKGNDVEVFKEYKRVYSGHIHYSQKQKNVTFVGNPYELTRSDINNKKGIYIIDIENDKEHFIKNDFSPRFMKYNILDIYDSVLEDIQEKIKNNFVDLYFPSDLISKYDVSSLMGFFEESARKVDPQIYEGKKIELEYEENEYANFDIINMTDSYLKSKGYDDTVSKRIIDNINTLMKESIIGEL